MIFAIESVEGLLAHQADVLRVYNEKLEVPDVAMELPTGSGKTLIGLLAGEYRRITRQERVVFLCPTRQLVHQVVEEAKSKYDIHPIAFTGSHRDYPPSDKSKYNDGEAIAVTTYSSLFNTKPFFHNPQFIILDDAHAAENYLVKYWSLSISRFKHDTVYNQFLEIVKDALPYEQYQRMTSQSPTPSDRSWVEKIPTPYFVERIHKIIPFLDQFTADNNTDGTIFERAHEDLGKLLGYRAGNSDESTAPDPWWIAGNDFCLAAEDYTDTDGTKPISAYKVRQANDHPIWISHRVQGLSERTTYVRVIISPSVTVQATALNIAQDIAYWNQSEFIQWAHIAVQVIRTLRLDFTGVGNEKWRVKAMDAYRNAGLDPVSIQKYLEKSPLTKLKLQ